MDVATPRPLLRQIPNSIGRGPWPPQLEQIPSYGAGHPKATPQTDSQWKWSFQGHPCHGPGARTELGLTITIAISNTGSIVINNINYSNTITISIATISRYSQDFGYLRFLENYVLQN